MTKNRHSKGRQAYIWEELGVGGNVKMCVGGTGYERRNWFNPLPANVENMVSSE
jgi:hypothetical protein